MYLKVIVDKFRFTELQQVDPEVVDFNLKGFNGGWNGKQDVDLVVGPDGIELIGMPTSSVPLTDYNGNSRMWSITLKTYENERDKYINLFRSYDKHQMINWLERELSNQVIFVE